jgi:hypothetical protein
LSPGGLLVVATGSTQSFFWRLLPLDYWYYFSEHVSFFSRPWFEWAAQRMELRVELIQPFARFTGTSGEKWLQALRACGYALLKASKKHAFLFKCLGLLYPFNRIRQWHGAPETGLWPDHILVAMRKKKS